MTKHFIRDLLIPGSGGQDGGYYASMGVIYHFLRLMGWTWLWECDGHKLALDPNPVDDGNMEDSGTAAWTLDSAGAAVKDVTDWVHGRQCIKWSPDPVGVERLTNTGYIATIQTRWHQLGFWFKTTTAGFTCDINTAGVWNASGLTIAADGVWHYYQTTFFTVAPPTTMFVNVRFNSPGGAPNDAFLDGVSIWFSFFEEGLGLNQDLTDGIFNAGTTEFSSSSYTFVAGDIGKAIVAYDVSNPENSGAWKIASINAGKAVCDLRAQGSPTFTASTSIPWRLVDLAWLPHTSGVAPAFGCGWGLQSPYEDWRLFARCCMQSGSHNSGICLWSSPTDCDFDWAGHGEFYPGKLSTQQLFAPQGSYNPVDATSGATMYGLFGDITYRAQTQTRLYFMTEDDGHFIAVGLRPYNGSIDEVAHCVIGFSGADTYHSLQESFAHMSANGTGGNELTWEDSHGRFRNQGAQSNPSGHYMVEAKLAIFNWNGVDEESDIVNGRPNPFNNEEWIREHRLIRDFDGYEGCPSIKTLSNMGQYVSRCNLEDDVGKYKSFDGIDGTGDTIGGAAPNMTLTDAAGLFTAGMVGKTITISGATTPANDGVFTISSYTSPTQIGYQNASGVAEAYAGDWEVNVHSYFLWNDGMVWEWMGEHSIA